MYKPLFYKRHVLVFRQFQNKGWSLFSCLGREVVCSVLSVSTLTYASAGTISTQPVTADSTATKTARELTLDEVSITGSRAPLTKSQAARMVTVLERADIAQAPVQSVNDLLKYAVGIDVRQRGPIGAQTDISMRGGTQEQIIILLNGINICDPQTGHNTVDLPCQLSDIQRIEVLEGPAGRIYGTSSLVGAINIVTTSDGGRPAKDAIELGSLATEGTQEGRNVEVQIEGGSYGYANVGFRYSPSTLLPAPITNSISANYKRSDGYSRSRQGTLNSDYSGAKAFYQGQYRDNGLRVNWHFGITDKGWGSSTAYASPKWQADDQYEHTTKLTAALQSSLQRGAVLLHPTIYWTQHQDRYEGYRGRPDLLKYNYNRTDVVGLQLNSHFDWTLGRTALGAELRNENLLSGNLGEPLSRPHHISGTDRDYTLGLNRTNMSAFAEHNVLLRNLTVSAGFVVTKNTWADMDWSIYPGIDASLRLGSHWRLHASYNTSLRLPSFTEMYYRLQGYSADPHLKPEEMGAVEVGATFTMNNSTLHPSPSTLHTSPSTLHPSPSTLHSSPSTLHPSPFTLSLTLWHHHGRNMIDWVMDTRRGRDATWQSVNHTRLNSLGLETSATLHLNASTINISYSFIHQEKDLEEGVVSQYAMDYLRHKLVAGVKVPLFRRLRFSADMRWQDRAGEYTDFDGTVSAYKPYCIVDARLAWQQSVYEVYGECTNLLDTAYRDYGLVPQPGRWLTAGISVRL